MGVLYMYVCLWHKVVWFNDPTFHVPDAYAYESAPLRNSENIDLEGS